MNGSIDNKSQQNDTFVMARMPRQTWLFGSCSYLYTSTRRSTYFSCMMFDAKVFAASFFLV